MTVVLISALRTWSVLADPRVQERSLKVACKLTSVDESLIDLLRKDGHGCNRPWPSFCPSVLTTMAIQ